MARGKRSTTESAGLTENDSAAIQGEQKVKSTSPKVTLVKPVQEEAMSEQNEEASAIVAPKPKARPKVGRAASSRKKKSETGEVKEKVEAKEKKESKARAEQDVAEMPDLKTEMAGPEAASVEKTPIAKTVTAEASAREADSAISAIEARAAEEKEKIRTEHLASDLQRMQLPSDWDTASHSRREDIKFTLFLIVVFIAVIVGLGYVLSNNHKVKVKLAGETPSASATIPAVKPPALPTAKLPAITIAPAPIKPAASAPTVPPAPAPVAANPEPRQPVAVTPPAPVSPQARAQAPASAAAASEADKTRNQQELLSILGKDQ